MKINKKFIYSLTLIIAVSCSRMEESEKDLIRKSNETQEKIIRYHNDFFFGTTLPTRQEQEKYPWEQSTCADQLKITKEYFRCKGSNLNLSHEYCAQFYADCNGIDDHGLPYRDGKEYIYPIFIDLLNFVQERTMKKVIVTSGHRCPKHNSYAAPMRPASKHQIGAEVDFYVEGYEYKPLEVVKILMQFYQEQGHEAYRNFVQKGQNGQIIRWNNREITISLHEKEKERDFDNRHPYPYITIELCFDRFEQKPIEYSWQKANNGYLRN